MLTRQQITEPNQNVLRLRLIERVKMQEMVLLSSRWVGRMVQCYNDDCAEHSIWDGISMGHSVIRAAFPRLEILLLESPNQHSGGRNWGSWWREERWLHHHGGYDHSWGRFFIINHHHYCNYHHSCLMWVNAKATQCSLCNYTQCSGDEHWVVAHCSVCGSTKCTTLQLCWTVARKWKMCRQMCVCWRHTHIYWFWVTVFKMANISKLSRGEIFSLNSYMLVICYGVKWIFSSGYQRRNPPFSQFSLWGWDLWECPKEHTSHMDRWGHRCWGENSVTMTPRGVSSTLISSVIAVDRQEPSRGNIPWQGSSDQILDIRWMLKAMFNEHCSSSMKATSSWSKWFLTGVWPRPWHQRNLQTFPWRR